MNSQLKGYLFGFLSSLFVSIQFIITKKLLEIIEFSDLIFYQFLMGFCMVLAYVLFKYKKVPVRVIYEHGKNLFSAGFFIGVASICWVYSISALGPATTSFISKLNILFSVLLGVILLKEKLNRYEYLGILLSFVGVLLISYNKDIALMLTALITVVQALAFSLHGFFIQKAVKKVNISIILLSRVFIALVLITLFNLIYNGISLYKLSPYWSVLLFITPLIGIVINNAFRYSSQKHIGLSKNAAISSVEPIIVSLLSLVFLGASLSPLKYLSGIIIIAGVLLLIFYRKKKYKIRMGPPRLS